MSPACPARSRTSPTGPRALKEADCVRIYVEKAGTREKIRPEYNAALADLRPADNTLTVTMLDRLGRNMVELITSAQDPAERGHRLEIRTGPSPAPTTRTARARSSSSSSQRWPRSSGSSSANEPSSAWIPPR